MVSQRNAGIRNDNRIRAIENMARRYGATYREAEQVHDQMMHEARSRVVRQNVRPLERYLMVEAGNRAHAQMQRDIRERGTVSRSVYMRNYNAYKQQYYRQLYQQRIGTLRWGG